MNDNNKKLDNVKADETPAKEPEPKKEIDASDIDHVVGGAEGSTDTVCGAVYWG